VEVGITLPAANERTSIPANAIGHWSARAHCGRVSPATRSDGNNGVGELIHGSPPIFGLAQSRMDERQWRGYAPSTPLTRESGPWTVMMSMGDKSLDHAVTVLPKLLLPMSLSMIANRRLEQIPADKFDMILPMHSVNPKYCGPTTRFSIRCGIDGHRRKS